MRTWLVVLTILAVMMITAACGSGEEIFTESTGTPAVKDVTVTASNWKFDQAEYHVKKGETFKLTFNVQEGAHGLKIEGMKGSMIGKSGDASSKTYVANKEGEYAVICSVACGTGHSQMRAKIIVD